MTSIDNQPTGTRENAAARRVQALKLRIQGKSYRDIAAALSVNVRTAYNDVQTSLAELAELERATAETYRTMSELRLFAMLEAIWPKVQKGNIEAVHAGVRIDESWRKLRGLDAPAKTALTNPDGTPLAVHYIELRAMLLATLPPEMRPALADALEVLSGDQPADS
jgi:hypothetical protein